MTAFPDWMRGCPGRRSFGVGGWAGGDTLEPSLTGLHKFDRISRKKEDEGKTRCQVCGGAPEPEARFKAWRAVIAAEEEAKDEKKRRALAKAGNGK